MNKILTTIAFAVAVCEAFAGWDTIDGRQWFFQLNADDKAIIVGEDGNAAVSPAPQGYVEIPKMLMDRYAVVAIGDAAFNECDALTGVKIPASVTSIGTDVFAGCSSLEKIDVDENNETYKSVGGMLLTKDGTTLLQGVNGDVATPATATAIAAYAFNGRGRLKSISIGDSVADIGESAFQYCNALTEAKLGNSVASIGSYAFLGCGNLKEISIPDSVTSIGEEAFYDCAEALFDTTTIPGVSLVDSWVAGYSEELSGNIDLTGIRGIAQNAFYECTGLTGVTIDGSVNGIGDSAFADCASLEIVTMTGDCPTIGEDVFGGVADSCRVRIPEGNATYIVENGQWHGLPVEYYNSLASFDILVDGASAKFEMAGDGRTRIAAVDEGTKAADVKVCVGGVDVTKGYSISVDGNAAKIALLNPYDVERTGLPAEPWTENEDGTTVTLNIKLVPGLYYAAAGAGSIDALKCPGSETPAKDGDALRTGKQSGKSAFYKVWVSDTPFAAQP